MVELAVIQRLMAISAVTAITGTRWWVLKLPQSPKYPAGRVQFVDEDKPFQLRGPAGVNRARVQVDLYVDEATVAQPYVVLSALAKAVDGNGLGENASGLLGWKGMVGSTFEVLGVFRAGDYGVRYDPDELRVLTRTHDYYVHWRAA